MPPWVVTAARAGAKVTAPGPRCLWNDTLVTLRDASCPFPFGSSPHTLMAIGVFAFPVRVVAVAVGGPVNFGPPCANDRTGGALFIPISLYGAMLYGLPRANGMACVSPFTVSVHVAVFLPKSFGTLTTKTPH